MLEVFFVLVVGDFGAEVSLVFVFLRFKSTACWITNEPLVPNAQISEKKCLESTWMFCWNYGLGKGLMSLKKVFTISCQMTILGGVKSFS